MRPNPLISDAGKDKQKTREQLLTELAGLQGIVTALKDEQAGCERIIGMLDGIAEPLFILDEATRIVYANSAAGRLLDTGHEQLMGKRLWDVYPKSKDTLFYHVFTKAAADRNPASFAERHPRKSKWFEVDLYPVAGGMVVLFHDITVRRHKDELQRLALVLLHSLKENIFLMRADGRLFHVNSETRYSLGYSTDELVRKCIFDLVPQANLPQWQDILDQIRQRGSTTFESRLRTKDGREFPVEVYANYIELYGQSYYTVSARDITERKTADELIKDARSRAELYLDLMGHDIKNQNMVAVGNIEMAVETLAQAGKLGPDSKAFLDRSLQSLENTTVLIDNVQKLQRATSEGQKLWKTDVCTVFEDVVGGFRATVGRDLEIRLRHCPACTVYADELLKDAFVNLIGNSIKHSRPDSHLIIDTALDIVEEGGKKYCMVTIADNGPGIPDDTKGKLFKRFSRGETKARGSGLGLYLVRTLVEHYGGRIAVEDRVPGDYTKGARFVVMIPSVE